MSLGFNQYYDRSVMESGFFHPSLGDIAHQAKDAYLGLFTDWDVAEWQRYEDKAFHYYMASLYSLEDNQGWNSDLVQLLRQNALNGLKVSHSAAQFWSYILATEQQIIIDAGYNPASIPNYSKHLDFLKAATDAVEGHRDVLDEFSPHKQIFTPGKDSYEDLKKILVLGFGVLVIVSIAK